MRCSVHEFAFGLQSRDHKPTFNDYADSLPCGLETLESSLFQITHEEDPFTELATLGQVFLDRTRAQAEKLSTNSDPYITQGRKKPLCLTASLNEGRCTCFVQFGGDTKMENIAHYRAADMTEEGQKLQEFVITVLLKNSKSPYSFHALLNKYYHGQDHHLEFHTDSNKSYGQEPIEPISSFSTGTGSVILISRKGAAKGKARPCIAVFQPVGSVLVMGGKFQSQFQHAIPSLAEMQRLIGIRENDEVTPPWGQGTFIVTWLQGHRERCRLELERIAHLQTDDQVRWACTVRWIRHHRPDCYVVNIAAPAKHGSSTKTRTLHLRNGPLRTRKVPETHLKSHL